uniref:Thymocyte nuclear protein 1 n=1 Tax=Tetradesmus obliquus TaxID=3088 RepID=A0A383V9Z6_TETOB|eukprot:jgi/Sobl393_1/19310/SZX61166.1
MGRVARATAAGVAECAGTADSSQQQQPAIKRQRVKQMLEQQTEPAEQATSAQTDAAAAQELAAAAKKPAAAAQEPAAAAKKPAAAAQATAAAKKPGRKKGTAAAAAAAAAAPSTTAATADALTSDAPVQQFFLVKSEPDAFSIDQLEARPNQTEGWDGVRNAQARNNMRSMRLGDLAFFYHSSCKVPGIVGIVKVVREAYPDVTAFDPASQYYDASSSRDNPKWWQVDFQLVRKLSRQITLEELKTHKEGSLTGMALFNRPRLSVQQVTQQEWQFVLGLEAQESQQQQQQQQQRGAASAAKGKRAAS